MQNGNKMEKEPITNTGLEKLKKDNEKTLAIRLLKIENKLYPRAVKKFIATNL